MVLRLLVLASVVVAAGCGGESDARTIDAVGVVGEPLVVELGGPAEVAGLPSGATLVGDRLEWTPAAEHEGEHVLSFRVVRDGIAEPTVVRVSISPPDASVEYGGCECGSKPRPPRPRSDALGIVLIAAYWSRRRRRAVRAFA